MGNFAALIPLIIFLAVCAGVAFYVRSHSEGKNFVNEYFIKYKLCGIRICLKNVKSYVPGLFSCVVVIVAGDFFKSIYAIRFNIDIN
jgi:Na+/pantothenate symporter